jgi:hypothetical protein
VFLFPLVNALTRRETRNMGEPKVNRKTSDPPS